MCILILRRVISRSIFGRRSFDCFSSFFNFFLAQREDQEREGVSVAKGYSLYTGVRLWMYISNRPDALL